VQLLLNNPTDEPCNYAFEAIPLNAVTNTGSRKRITLGLLPREIVRTSHALWPPNSEPVECVHVTLAGAPAVLAVQSSPMFSEPAYDNWKDTKGKVQLGAYVDVRGDDVGLRLPDGQVRWFPYEAFCDADQARIADLLRSRARIWKDNAESFAFEASYIELKSGMVLLEGAHGEFVELKISELSPFDRRWIERVERKARDFAQQDQDAAARSIRARRAQAESVMRRRNMAARAEAERRGIQEMFETQRAQSDAMIRQGINNIRNVRIP
jgi:hypothetical protein